MTETSEAATMMHACGVKRTRKAQERSRQNETGRKRPFHLSTRGGRVRNAVDKLLSKTASGRTWFLSQAASYRWGIPNKAPVNPSMLLNPRRYGDGAKDLWTTLNTVQENIIRGGQRDYSRRRPDGSRMPKSRAIKGIDEDMKLNKALWQMAEVLRSGGVQA